jgi:hypothetical protein
MIPQVSRMKAYIFNYKIYVHDNMLCIIYKLILKKRPRYNFALDDSNEKTYTGNEIALKTLQT